MKRDLATVGRSERRVDSVKLATGRGTFVDDIALPGLLHAKILHSPHAHARIVSIDASQARAMPGVACVLTHEDVPRVPYTTAGQGWPEPSPYDSVMLDSQACASWATGWPWWRRRTRSWPDAPATPSRSSTRCCPRCSTPRRPWPPGRPSSTTSRTVRDPRPEAEPGGGDRGRGRAAWPRASPRRSTSSRAPTGCPTSSSPRSSRTSRSPGSTRTTAWSCAPSTQVPFHVRRIIAPLLGIPVRRIRVIKPRIGGGFGGKQEILIEDLCGLLTLRTGRPVRLEYTREEELTAARTRHPQILTVKTGVKDGRFTAIELKVLENTGAYGTHALTVMSVTGNRALSLYRCPNLRYEARAVYTNLAVAGAFRGYGCPQGFFALESHVDEVAHGAGRGPPRVPPERNHVQRGRRPADRARCSARGARGSRRSSVPAGCPRPSTRGRRPSAGRTGAAGRGGTGTLRRGIGMAIVMQASGIPGVDMGAASHQDERGRLLQPARGSHRHRAPASDTMFCQLAAEALGVRDREDHPLLVGHRHDALRPRGLRLLHHLHLGPRGREGRAWPCAS